MDTEPPAIPPDEYAPFARLYDPVVGPLLAEMRLEVAALALRLGARSVLDVCCGTGAQLAMLRRAGLRCTGVDLSAAMLARAREHTAPDIAYLRCDAARLPLADHGFDLAVICFALHEKPAPVRVAMLAEAVRVLRPGGTLAVADYDAAPGARARLGRLAASLVERAAGAEHFGLFRDFVASGGAPALLERCGLPHAVVRRTSMDAAVLAVSTT